MSLVFTTPRDILVRTRDGHNFTLMEDIEVRTEGGARYRAPMAAETDGASTPKALWPNIPPFGEYFLACILHDCAYRNTLLRQLENGFWVPAFLTKEQSDLLLLDAMTALGVDQFTKETIYDGVSKFGMKAFRDDRTSLAPRGS